MGLGIRPRVRRLRDVPGGPFTRVIADPPWKYGSKGLVGVGGRKVEHPEKYRQVDAAGQYPCMAVDEIKRLPVSEVAASDSLLFLWVTNAFLADGSGPEVARAWGFIPKTILTWAKAQADSHQPSMKTGYWFRGASEHILVAVRGKPKRPEDFPALPTWFMAPRLRHSAKPDKLHAWVEATGDGPYLEMFARSKGRLGWSYWGRRVG